MTVKLSLKKKEMTAYYFKDVLSILNDNFGYSFKSHKLCALLIQQQALKFCTNQSVLFFNPLVSWK